MYCEMVDGCLSRRRVLEYFYRKKCVVELSLLKVSKVSKVSKSENIFFFNFRIGI